MGNTAKWAEVIKPEDSPQGQNVALRLPFAEELFIKGLYTRGGLKELDYGMFIWQWCGEWFEGRLKWSQKTG